MARRTLAALALLLVLAACGSTHRRPPMTRAAFDAAADRACTAASTRTDLIARLHTLRPPAAGGGLYAHWLTAERDALAAAKASPHASQPGELDPRVVLAIDDGKIAGYAGRLGASACARRAAGTLPP